MHKIRVILLQYYQGKREHLQLHLIESNAPQKVRILILLLYYIRHDVVLKKRLCVRLCIRQQIDIWVRIISCKKKK